jgi:hypothetical protein
MASITVQSGAVSGTIGGNATFEWLNTSTTGDCLVSNVGSWCTDSSYSVPKATAQGSGRITATTLNVNGNFTYSSTCYNAPGMPSIHVGSK